MPSCPPGATRQRGRKIEWDILVREKALDGTSVSAPDRQHQPDSLRIVARERDRPIPLMAVASHSPRLAGSRIT
jgi:hypothetical protein